MDALYEVVANFGVALQPTNLMYTFIGVLLGTLIGILPGLGPSAGIALLMPLTFGMDATPALIMMAGIYYGAMYGGSSTSILINTPGEANSVITALDGYQMARNGRAGAALAISAWGSFIAGTLSVIALTLLAIPLANLALEFGPPQYFALMVLAISTVSALTGNSVAKGLIATFLGLLIATIGTDLQSGRPRFTLGSVELLDGIDFVVVVVGLFAISEVFVNVEEHVTKRVEPIRITGKLRLTAEEWSRSWLPILRGTGIGFLVGVLPGAGASVATILSYVTERKISKHPEKFGQGAIEGVAGPEAANNASAAGAMVPLLTLGVPGGPTAAVMLGAFIMFGIQPGPLLFEKRPDLVWGLVNSMYVGNMMLLVLNLPLIKLFVRILYIPTGILLPLVLGVSAVGIYSLNGDTFDLYVALFFGVIGYLFKIYEIPATPLVLSLVLGGIMEQSFRQSLTASGGSMWVFFESGISFTLLMMAILVLFGPLIAAQMRRLRQKEPVSLG